MRPQPHDEGHSASTPRQRRASKPKVRSGCVTCKTRRMKCDEEKPTCSNCLRSRRTCKYVSKPTGFIQYHVLAPAHSERSSCLIKNPSFSLFMSEQELRYFNVFQHQTAGTLSGFFTSDLWGKVILQCCEQNPEIRACVIAIGALDQTLESSHHAYRMDLNGVRSSNTFDGNLPHAGSEHHRFALGQYGRAIKQLRASLLKENPDARSAVIGCVLTACFEALHGDFPSAILQVRNGLKLIRCYFPAGTKGMASRLGSKTDIHEILQFFDRMDNDSIFLKDLAPVNAVQGTRPVIPRDSINNMPAAFSSLQEAQAYFEFYLKTFLRWIAYQLAWSSKENNETTQREPPTSQPPPFAEEKAVYMQAFAKWHKSFLPLLNSYSKDSKDYPALLALDIRLKSLDTSLGVTHFHGDVDYDDLTPQFQEVLNITKRLAKYESGTTQPTNFSPDWTLISYSIGATHRCRNPCVRRQAIEILEARKRREGVDDGWPTSKIARIQLNFEESGLMSEIIPEEARLVGLRTSNDAVKREGYLTYLTKNAKTGGYTHHQISFFW